MRARPNGRPAAAESRAAGALALVDADAAHVLVGEKEALAARGFDDDHLGIEGDRGNAFDNEGFHAEVRVDAHLGGGGHDEAIALARAGAVLP